MGLVEAIMQGSSLVREAVQEEREQGRVEGEAQGLAKGEAQGLAKGEAQGLAKGEAQGLAKGQAKGQAEEARRLLRMALADRFPGLETMPEIDRIGNIADLESLLIQHAIRSHDRDSVAQAILSSVPDSYKIL